MKKIFLTFCFVSVLLSGLFSQVNQKYIQKETAKQAKWLDKYVFVNGYVLNSTNDTIKTEILVFSKRHKINAYLFCVTKDPNSRISIVSASEIMGYGYGQTHYKKAKDGTEHFFIKRIQVGSVNLYERTSIPSDMRFLYYLQKKNQQGYFEICPDEANFKIKESKNSNNSNNSTEGANVIIMTNNNVGRFKLFVQSFFCDCVSVINKVNAEVYSISDLPSIVTEYNIYKNKK